MTQAEKDVVLSLRQQQYSFSAIAETIGLPLGTIKSFGFIEISFGKRKSIYPEPPPLAGPDKPME